MGWIESIEHSRWLSNQLQALLVHGRAAWAPTGYGYFRADGSLDKNKPVDLAITARMTFAYSLGTLLGIPGCRRYCDHGVSALRTFFRDREHGGWFTAIEHKPGGDGRGVPRPDCGADKSQYSHAFLVLAAATAAVANRPGAHELLCDALDNQEDRWWDESTGSVFDRYNRDWSVCAPYRGMNSLMHSAEAYMAAGEATNDPLWIQRAERLLRRAYTVAERYDGRVPEHYDQDWNPLLNFNIEAPNMPHYPYGFVIGHGMELARLGTQMRGAIRDLGAEEPDYLLSGAVQIFDRARADGWRRGGKPGFLYTVDFQGNPVLTDRLQWVVSEAITATVALRRAVLDDGGRMGEVELYDHSYRTWVDYLNDYMMLEPGVFARILDEDSEPQEGTITTRPDIYHTIQALLAARLPLWPPVGAALQHGLLDKPQGAPPRPQRRRFRTWKPQEHEGFEIWVE